VIEPSGAMTYSVAPVDTQRRSWLSKAMLRIVIKSGNAGVDETADPVMPVPAIVSMIPSGRMRRVRSCVESVKTRLPPAPGHAVDCTERDILCLYASADLPARDRINHNLGLDGT